MLLSTGAMCPSGSVTLVSTVVMCGKKTSRLTKAAESFDINGCKIQNLKSWFSAYCLSCWFKKSLLRSLQWCNHTEILQT